MEFLNKIGIDINLLIAQLINFGLLLFLLSKFLYKPIMKRIESDEKELRELKTKKEELEKERSAFEDLKLANLKEVRERSRLIIEEAEGVAKKVEERYKAEIAQEKKEFEEGEKKELQAAKEDMADALREEIIKEVDEKLKDIMLPDVKKELTRSFFKKLLESINAMDFGGERASDEVLSNGVILEYAFLPTKDEGAKLKEAISKKFRLPESKIKIKKKKNNNILSGYRLEMDGFSIESNMLNEIRKITK